MVYEYLAIFGGAAGICAAAAAVTNYCQYRGRLASLDRRYATGNTPTQALELEGRFDLYTSTDDTVVDEVADMFIDLADALFTGPGRALADRSFRKRYGMYP